MKFGIRTPSLKKTLKARTTGKVKRQVKKALIPGYGKKEWAGLKIQRKQHIIKFTTRQVLVCLIYSSRDTDRRDNIWQKEILALLRI